MKTQKLMDMLFFVQVGRVPKAIFSPPSSLLVALIILLYKQELIDLWMWRANVRELEPEDEKV